MRIKNFEEVSSKLQEHLNDYLSEFGINPSKLFSCINPAHEDSTPSCGSNGKTFHCFSCSAAGGIFKAAHFLENKPLVGKAFITDNLMYLADKYEIEVDATPLTEEEMYVLDTYRIYSHVEEYVSSHHNTEHFIKVLKDRKWTSDLCKEYGVGSVDTYKNFREYLKDLGFAAQFVDDVDINRYIYDNNNLIFCIKDATGRTVGCAARNLLFTKDKEEGSKYINTSAKCSIFKKSFRLFGLDQAIKHRRPKEKLVYIFEGYSDVLTAAHAGIKNCVALGSASFSQEQLQLLKDYNFYDLCICLDGDDTGRKKTKSILDNILSNQRDLKVSIIEMEDGYDPDDYIREFGAKKFKELKHWTAFEWRINQLDDNMEPEAICETMIPIIVNEMSSVKRDKLEKILADHTNLNISSIHKDVERLQNDQEISRLRERDHILDKLIYRVQTTKDEAEYALAEAENSLFELSKRSNIDGFSVEQYLNFLQVQKQEEEAKDGSFSGFLLGPDLKNFEQALCGDWKHDVWLTFGGAENIGKSAFLLKLGFSIAQQKENNAVVLYHSIDDTKEQLTPRCVCLGAGGLSITINQVADPNYFIRSGKCPESILSIRERGYEKLIDLGKNGYFVMKDANDGMNLQYVDRLIRYYKDKYPERDVVYILDNFHKLQDFQSSQGDERVRFKAMSTMIKNMATKHHISILSTVEYTKLPQGHIPVNNSVSETKQISYDANVICHLYSDLHEYGDKSETYHIGMDSNKNFVRMPRIQITFGKNKVSNYKGRQFYDFYPEYANFAHVEDIVVEEEEAQRRNSGQNRFTNIMENGLIDV